MATKYGCELAKIHTAWRRYVEDNQLDPRALQVPDGHMNDWGCFLMAHIVEACDYLEGRGMPATEEDRQTHETQRRRC